MPSCQHFVSTCGNGKTIEFCVSDDGCLTIYPDASPNERDQYNLSAEDTTRLVTLLDQWQLVSATDTVLVPDDLPALTSPASDMSNIKV